MSTALDRMARRRGGEKSVRISRRSLRKGLVLVGCLVGAPVPVGLLIGGTLMLLGCALHLWSKGCLEQNRRLIMSG